MSSTLPKLATLETIAQSGHRSVQNTLTHIPKLDFSIFRAKEIRDILKSKAHCLQAGFPSSHLIIKTLNDIRDHYLARVGLPTYLSQMLGELAQAPIQSCSLYDETGHRLTLDFQNNPDQPVQRFITRKFRSSNLPFIVEVRQDFHSDRVEVRYL